MITRLAKMLLLAGIALFYTLVVFNNLTDFGSNYEFVRHVLSMDSIFPGSRTMWRALSSPTVHLVFYWLIIAWEFVTMVLAWWGFVNLFRALRMPASDYIAAKRVADSSVDTLTADVACGVSGCGRRMVPDVAVACMERSG